MATIPLNPSAISGAMTYPVIANAIPIGYCPGASCLPMQFTFGNTTVWKVDLGNSQAGANSLKKIASIFIDNSNCTHDINLLFPDTGYQLRVEQGGSRMLPIITGPNNHIFYVILDSSNVVSATDIVNLIVLDTYIPEFQSHELINTLAYGFGPLFVPQPLFAQAASFQKVLSAGVDSAVLIAAKQYYITGVILSLGGHDTVGTVYEVQLTDTGSGNVSLQAFYLGTTPTFLNILQLTGMNYISGGTNLNLTVVPAAGGSDNFAADVRLICTVFGGILVP